MKSVLTLVAANVLKMILFVNVNLENVNATAKLVLVVTKDVNVNTTRARRLLFQLVPALVNLVTVPMNPALATMNRVLVNSTKDNNQQPLALALLQNVTAMDKSVIVEKKIVQTSLARSWHAPVDQMDAQGTAFLNPSMAFLD